MLQNIINILMFLELLLYRHMLMRMTKCLKSVWYYFIITLLLTVSGFNLFMFFKVFYVSNYLLTMCTGIHTFDDYGNLKPGFIN